jgi:hypothetical protein
MLYNYVKWPRKVLSNCPITYSKFCVIAKLGGGNLNLFGLGQSRDQYNVFGLLNLHVLNAQNNQHEFAYITFRLD